MEYDAISKAPSLPAIDPDTYEDADVAGDEYRREELEAFLAAGAWATAFERWAARTEMTTAELAVARDLDLFERFDFFRDFNRVTRPIGADIGTRRWSRAEQGRAR